MYDESELPETAEITYKQLIKKKLKTRIPSATRIGGATMAASRTNSTRPLKC